MIILSTITHDSKFYWSRISRNIAIPCCDHGMYARYKPRFFHSLHYMVPNCLCLDMIMIGDNNSGVMDLLQENKRKIGKNYRSAQWLLSLYISNGHLNWLLEINITCVGVASFYFYMDSKLIYTFLVHVWIIDAKHKIQRIAIQRLIFDINMELSISMISKLEHQDFIVVCV